MRPFRRRNKLKSIPPWIRGLPNPELQAELAYVMPFLHMCCRLAVVESSVVVPPDNPKALIIKEQENIRLTDGDVWVRAVIKDEYSASFLVCRNKIRKRSQCFWLVTLNEYALQWTARTSEFIILINDLSVIKEAHCLEEFTERLPNVMLRQGIADHGQRNSSPPSPPSTSCRESACRSCSCSSSGSCDSSATASPKPSPVRLPEVEAVPLPGVFAFGRNAEPSTSLSNSEAVPAAARIAPNEEDAGPSCDRPSTAQEEEQPAEVWVPGVDLDEPSPSPSEILSDVEFQDARSIPTASFHSPLVDGVATASPTSLRTCQGPSQYPTPYSPAALSATEMKEFEEKAAVTIVRQDDEDLSTIVDVDEVSDTNCQNGSAEDVSIVSVIDPREHVVSASSTSLSLHTDFSNKENIPLPPPSPLSPDKNAILSGDPQRCYVPASPPRPSSTDAVDSRNSSTAAGVLNSILWPFNRKLRNSSPFGDIYSPLNANQLNAETSNQRKATDKQSACQPSNLPWYMKVTPNPVPTHSRSIVIETIVIDDDD
uniref:Uncharacterized protein n=1 Tax=Schistocephalus solidus TaxID=70667 RepID=A0A0X3NVD0_SCHSO